MKLPLFSIARHGASTATDITARLVQPSSWLSKLATLALGLYLAHQAWNYFLPPKRELSPHLQELGTKVVQQFVGDFRSLEAGPRSAALLHLEGDHTDYLTTALRDALETNNVVDLGPTSMP